MISKTKMVFAVLMQLLALFLLYTAIMGIDSYEITLIDSGVTLTTSDTLQPDGNMRDSVIGKWYGFRFLPQVVRFLWGINYMNADCLLGADNDSGAPFLVVQTRWNPYEGFREIIVDSMHLALRDSSVLFCNDFAYAKDTVWGYQIRAILKFEMDGDSASAVSGLDGRDTVSFNAVKVMYLKDVW